MPRRRARGSVALFLRANAEQLRRNKAATGAPVRAAPRTPARALYVVTNRNVVKVGITNSPNRRLAEHRRQGLWKVVYILRSNPQQVRLLENKWKVFVRRNPHLKVHRQILPDGYTEALTLNEEVRRFIDRLVGKSY